MCRWRILHEISQCWTTVGIQFALYQEFSHVIILSLKTKAICGQTCKSKVEENAVFRNGTEEIKQRVKTRVGYEDVYTSSEDEHSHCGEVSPRENQHMKVNSSPREKFSFLLFINLAQ